MRLRHCINKQWSSMMNQELLVSAGFVAFNIIGNIISLAVIYGQFKAKSELMDRRLEELEQKVDLMPEIYVTQAMFRDFMNRMESTMTEVRQDIKALIGIASKK